MAGKTEHNTPPKSDNNQHTSNQEMHSADSSDLSQETKSLEDIMQEMNYIGSKPEVQATLIPSYCQKVKKYCKLLVEYLLNFSSSNCEVKDTDKPNNIYNYIKSNVNDIYKGTRKLFGIASREQLSDPSLLQNLQEGLHELSKDVQKLYKFVIDNLKQLAVKLGIREETVLEKGIGVIKGAAAHAIEKTANSSFVNNVVNGTDNGFKNLVKRQRKASSKDKNTRAKNNNHRGRS